MVKAAAKGESGWVFAVPVTDDVAPGYSREIRNPMDLGAIAKKLKSGAYHTLGASIPHDVKLIAATFAVSLAWTYLAQDLGLTL